jgi:hypothetical protein
MKEETPEANEVLKWFRKTATSYTSFIPGAKSYVDTAFNDLDSVEKKHCGEIDEIESNAYSEIREATKADLSREMVYKTWDILQQHLTHLGELAQTSAGEILDNHPEIKEKVGVNLDELKNMANSYGPEAKKEFEKTYEQIKDVLSGGGVGVEITNKPRQIIDENVQKVKSIGDEAWNKGMEAAKPYFD